MPEIAPKAAVNVMLKLKRAQVANEGVTLDAQEVKDLILVLQIMRGDD